MMLRLTFLALLLVAVCGAFTPVDAQAEPDMLQPGVGRALARWRAAHYRQVRYQLQFEIVPGTDHLDGTAEIRVTLDQPADGLVLDWRVAAKDNQPVARDAVHDLVVNDQAVKDAQFINDHLVVPGAYLRAGENIMRLNFRTPVSASGSAVTRYVDQEDKREYLYTLFVPSDASTFFPCFDQPDLKARFQLRVAAPPSWKVVSNTRAETVMMNGAAPKFLSFGETEPLSTYHFAFAAGEFTELSDINIPWRHYGKTPPLRIFARKSQEKRLLKEFFEIVRLHREGLYFLSNYFDYKFPFPKYDLVIIPEFAYGGMEHAGATFLREEAILFPSDPTANDLAARAELMLHEASHQWFGDLVTMRWFDDLWLKEGFATFMAYKAMEQLLPQQHAWQIFYQRTKPAAYLTDATKGTTPIFQQIPNLSAAKSAYGNIVYRKAPSLLRQAEFYLGADNFQRAVRLVVKEHAYGNAEWGDLVHAFERTSGQKLDAWAAAWVTRRGMPDVRAVWSANKRGRINRFTLTQHDVLGEGGAWPMRVKVLLAYADRPPRTLIVKLDAVGATQVREAIGLPRPAYVFANDEDYGYGRFLLDDVSRARVMRDLGTVRNPFARTLLWGTLWDSVREAELAPLDYLNLGLAHLDAEADETIAQSLLARMQTAFNRYLSDAQQQEIAPRLERMIYRRMIDAAVTPGLRITYFRAYQAIAFTAAARHELKRLLSGDLKLPGVTLRARDRFDLVTALISRGDADAPALLEQLRRADTSDDARRYAYAAAAARPDAAVKRAYFAAYLSDPELAESWIEASVNPFNAFAQAELTRPYLAPALAALPELKRTRKIFFVNNWLAAFIGGQCSPDAAREVQTFLNRTPRLDRDLRLKILEAADGLDRCVRIRTRYAAAR